MLRRKNSAAECRPPGNAGICSVVGGKQGYFLAVRIHTPSWKPLLYFAKEGTEHRARTAADDHYVWFE
jgi:hypothetical protein